MSGRPAAGAGSNRPDLSVVVPSVNGGPVLFEVLEALFRQEGDVVMEVLLPERCGESIRSAVGERFPAVRVFPVAPRTPIPEMRRVAFDAADADSVAVIEDHVIVPPTWSAALARERLAGNSVVGGHVYNAATNCLVDRAAFLCEYGYMLAPPRAGPVDRLIGINTMYDRELLRRFSDVIAEGRWEDHLHRAFREAGITLFSRPEIAVAHKMHFHSALEYATLRFFYSRAYADMRNRDAGLVRRLAYGIRTIALPPVLLGRIVKEAHGHPETRVDLIPSLPHLIFFTFAWALGEMSGALFGQGNALWKVR